MGDMNSGYANEKERADAMKKAKAKKKPFKNTLKPEGPGNKPLTPRGSRTVSRSSSSSTVERQRGATKPMPKATPKATVKPKPKATLGPLPKNPTLNDYLARGLKVPKAPGQKKLPSDADVKLPRRTR